jgi:hypothetical protein
MPKALTRLEQREQKEKAAQELAAARTARDQKQLTAMRGLDWSLIDADWKAGIKSLAQICDDYYEATGHRTTPSVLVNHYAYTSTPRDLGNQITAVAQAKAREAAGELLTPEEVALLKARELDDEIIEANAAVIAGTLIGHRKAVKRYQAITLQLLAEIEAQTFNADDLHQLGALMRCENERGVDKLNDLYHKIIATPGRVDAIKKLAETSKILIGLERQALGIADNANGDANKPQTPEAADMPPAEVARRVAFMLMTAQAEEAAEQPRVIDVTPEGNSQESASPSREGFDMENLA